MERRLPLSASALAGRPRAALAALLESFTDSIAQHVPVAVDAFEKELIETATEAETAAERDRCREALLKLGDTGEQLRTDLSAWLEDALARIDTVPPPSGVASADPGEQRVLEALADHVRAACGEALATLCERLGGLAGVAFDDYSVPLGPSRIAELMRRGAAALELDPALRPMLYHAVARIWLVHLPELYEDVNALLKRTRALIKAAPRAVAGDGFDWSAFERPLAGWPLVGLPHRELADTDDVRDADLDLQLRARLAEGGAFAAQSGGATSTLIDIDAALALIQKRPAQPLMLGGRLVPRTIAHLRQDLLVQLNADGRPARLGDAERETIELVARLYEALLGEHPANAPAHAILAKLQVPVLRAALIDPGFFTRRRQPARQFLGAIAESAIEWTGEEAEDKPAVERLDALASRALAEYKGVPEHFALLIDDYATSHAANTRKAQLAERRNIDAARGREKLELARRDADAEIARRLAAGRPTALVRAVLEEGWTKALAMTLMREPAGGPGHLSRLAVADRMVGALGPGRPAIDYEEETFLRREIEIGLVKVGYHAGDVQLITERLFSDDAAAHADVSIAARAAPRRAESKDDAKAEEPAAPPPVLPDDPRRARVRERLLALPPGAWIDVALERGRFARRKLAWASAASGRCLIVDQRGARIDEPALDEVAAAVLAGTMRVVAERDDSVVDRALRAI